MTATILDFRSRAERQHDALLEDHRDGHPANLDEPWGCSYCDDAAVVACQSGDCKGVGECRICTRAWVTATEIIGG